MLVLRFLSWLTRLLPLRLVLWKGAVLGMLAYWLFPSRRRITMNNLRHAFPDKTNRELKAIAKSMAKNMGRAIIEFLRMPSMNKAYMDRCIEWAGLEHLDNALKLGRGVLVLTAHLDNWDMVAAMIALKGYRTNIIAKHLSTKAFDDFWVATRARMNVTQIERAGSIKQIITALRHNELVGFILDQHTHASDGVLVDFFNRPAWTMPGLAVLAQRYDVPVVPCFMVRNNISHHKIIFEPAIPFVEKATPDETIKYNTQVYTKVLERYISEYPDQWIWMHRRWRP
jgi:Kdo2-lipid IVA lauroyltransferase/acyltransferase